MSEEAMKCLGAIFTLQKWISGDAAILWGDGY